MNPEKYLTDQEFQLYETVLTLNLNKLESIESACTAASAAVAFMRARFAISIQQADRDCDPGQLGTWGSGLPHPDK